MKDWIVKYKGVLLLVGVFLSLNLVFLFISPEEIVEYIGVNNTYLTIFLIASVGGLNSITGGVLYGSIAAFAAGGASPWLLGLVGGAGIAIGDSLVFYLFRYTSKSLSQEWEDKIAKVQKKVEHLPRSVQYFLIYIALGFTPLPNDILMFMLAVLRFQFWQVFPFILAGAITVATLTALLGNQIPFLTG
jgi:membrane protein DedA with SNARE-associated domain